MINIIGDVGIALLSLTYSLDASDVVAWRDGAASRLLSRQTPSQVTRITTVYTAHRPSQHPTVLLPDGSLFMDSWTPARLCLAIKVDNGVRHGTRR